MRVPSKTMFARAGMIAALVGLELYLARSLTSAPSIKGFVETHVFGVSSTQKGLVRKLDVALGDHVATGQVVAELDTGVLDMEIAALHGERRQLIAAARAGNGDDDGLRSVDKKLEVLSERRSAMRLVAPTDGVIESISVHQGDAVSSDTSVATIVTTDTRHVVACVPEQRANEVSVGSTAYVTSPIGGGKLSGVVESLTPAIAELPPRCQPVVDKPKAYGRLATVLLDHGAASLPGETELVAFGPPAATALVPKETVATVSPQPQDIDIPPSLAALSRVEASGIVWVPSLDRYIVVSDETGPTDRHTPWLFSMSQRGVMDPDPIVVSQLSELDDVESIASDGKDGLWLLASQSLSKNGKRPPARELLAHLVPEGVGYRADKQVKLATLLASVPGLDLQQLDIEGMAVRNGALFFGIKTPVDQGRAVIYKVAAPDKLLAGDVAGAGVTVWGRVAIPVQSNGASIPGGISDLTFLSDTSLVISATASAPGTKQQDGAIYLVTGAGGDLKAAPLQTFRGLRPEGVTPSPSGQLAVVFDNGRATPQWTEIELPGAE